MFDANLLNRLYRYAYGLCGNEADAYDLLQSAVEKMLTTPRSVSRPEAYVRKMIRNAFIDMQRRHASHPTVEFDETTSVADLDERALESVIISQRELAAVWPLMKPVEREILMLWAIDGLSLTRVAEELEMPRGTVLSTVHRMRRRLTELRATAGSPLSACGGAL